jgi:hypothetical protein
VAKMAAYIHHLADQDFILLSKVLYVANANWEHIKFHLVIVFVCHVQINHKTLNIQALKVNTIMKMPVTILVLMIIP